MTDPVTPAATGGMTYAQRKALRRISRGQSISRHVSQDPLIRQCYEWPAWTEPSKPPAEMNIVEWCDWEVSLISARPVITEFGKQLLATIEGPTDD